MDERYDEKNQGTWANDAQMPDILKDGNILAKETAKKRAGGSSGEMAVDFVLADHSQCHCRYFEQ